MQDVMFRLAQLCDQTSLLLAGCVDQNSSDEVSDAIAGLACLMHSMYSDENSNVNLLDEFDTDVLDVIDDTITTLEELRKQIESAD